METIRHRCDQCGSEITIQKFGDSYKVIINVNKIYLCNGCIKRILVGEES